MTRAQGGLDVNHTGSMSAVQDRLEGTGDDTGAFRIECAGVFLLPAKSVAWWYFHTPAWTCRRFFIAVTLSIHISGADIVEMFVHRLWWYAPVYRETVSIPEFTIQNIVNEPVHGYRIIGKIGSVEQRRGNILFL